MRPIVLKPLNHMISPGSGAVRTETMIGGGCAAIDSGTQVIVTAAFA